MTTCSLDLLRASETLMKEKQNSSHSLRGSVLAYTLILLSVVLIAAIGIATVSVTNERGTLLASRSVSAFQVADTGAQAAIVEIRETLASTPNAKLNNASFQIGGAGCSNAGGFPHITSTSSGTVDNYTLTFYDNSDPANILNCSADLADVASVKSVGKYRDTSRAVKVAVVPYQLVGHWRLNETSGTTASDVSGKGNNGTLQNGPSWASGALRFDGTNDVVSVANNSSLDLTKQVSISLWLNVTAFPTGAFVWAPLVSKMNDNGCVNSRTYSVWLNGVEKDIHLASYDSSGGQQRTLNTNVNSISTGSWYHYVGVIDRVSGAMTSYINGVESGGSTSFPPVDAITNSNPVRIGGLFNGAVCGDPSYTDFNGLIDDVRIYRGALSQEMVSDLYTAGRQ